MHDSIKMPPKLKLGKRPETIAALADSDDVEIPVEHNEIDLISLEPGVDNPIDAPGEYNPYKYCYTVVVEELNMELVIKFIIDSLNHDEKHPIEFIRDGKAYTIPFFPREQEGCDPIETWEGPGDHHDFYRAGEHSYYVYPAIVRAKIFGDPLANNGEGSTDVLVTKEFVREHITPERLAEALEALRDEVQDDPNAPVGLSCLLGDALGYNEWRGDGSSLSFGPEDDDDDYDDDDNFDDDDEDDDVW
jgi:hypothetical protein